MKMFTSFRSPAWEQRDPDKRAAAVRDEQAPELIALLPKIATSDEDAGVRRAALGRVQDLALLIERQRADADAATRAVAAARVSRLLLDPAAGLSLDARRAAIATLPADLVEKLAEAAPEVELRRAALQRVTRAGFLQKRVVDESDASLREEALARIDGEDVLERLAEALRKRDKTLARRARERVLALRLARGDSATLNQYALDLCDALAQWAQQLPADIDARLDEARGVFEARRPQLDETLQRRVEAYFERVQAARQRRDARAAAPVAPVPAAPGSHASDRDAPGNNAPGHDAASSATAASATESSALVADATAPNATAANASAANPTAANAAAPDFSAFDHALKQVESALRAQKLGEARPAFERARTLANALPRSEKARRERLAQAEEKLGELDQWQRWSGNRVRARLCEDVEALIAAAPHPDAVAHRVRELQAEWAKVEAAEPGDADRTSGLARRFRALCGRAMAPTKAYFDQRHALREQKREGYEALLGEAAGEKLAGLSAPALVGVRRKLAEGLRGLDELEPKVRSALAKQLRDGLTRIDAALDAQREDAALGRRKLIARLRRELTHADPGTALALARDAQSEWKTLPRASREAEAELDKELRALIDPLFAAERETRERGDAEARRIEAESKRLLDEIEALSQGDAETLAHAEGRIAALQAQWRELRAQAPIPAFPRERGKEGGARGDRGPRTGPARSERAPGRGDAQGDRRARGSSERNDRAPRSGDARSDRGPRGNDRLNDRGPRGNDARDGRGPRGNDVRDGRGPRGSDARDGRDPRRDDARRPRFDDPDRPFDQAVAKVRQAQATLEASRRGARLEAIAEASALFAAIARGASEKSDEAWHALALDDADRKRLAARWQQAAPQDEHALAQHDGALDAWLVDAELDANLETPSHSQALRRQHQMQRLATRLQGATLAATDPRERVMQFALLPAPSAARAAEFERRLRAVLAAWSR